MYGVHGKQRRGSGFTLVELMLVVVIIGVLVAMVAPRLGGRVDEARRLAARSDIANIGIALDLYEFDNGAYPQTLEELSVRPTKGEDWKGPYLKRRAVDPWGKPYIYRSPGERNADYDLSSLGADMLEGGGDDITNWDGEGNP